MIRENILNVVARIIQGGFDMIDLNENRAPSFVAFSVIFIVLSSLTVGLRLLSRRISAADFWWEYVLLKSMFLLSDRILSLET